MRAYVIGWPGEVSATVKSAQAAGLNPMGWLPHRPEDAPASLDALGLRWNWPLSGTATIAGLTCHAYKTRDPRARISCFLAHYALWRVAAEADEPVMAMESDCQWIRRWDQLAPVACFGMVSLNDPRGATRMAKRYHELLQIGTCHGIVHCPWVDDDHSIPQGLPGHSAYVIQPWFARELIAKVREVGAGPNDAIANRQWFPGRLGCVTQYFTKVSGRPSSLA